MGNKIGNCLLSRLAHLPTHLPFLVIFSPDPAERRGDSSLSFRPHGPQIREGVVKIVDGVLFGVRGVKLLLSDIGSCGKLFWRAVRGECPCPGLPPSGGLLPLASRGPARRTLQGLCGMEAPCCRQPAWLAP